MDDLRASDRHEEVQLLLPWFVTGTLDEDDRLRVSEHLAECKSCRAELEAERALGATVAAMPIDTDLNWASMRQRMTAAPATPKPWRRARGLIRQAAARPGRTGMVIAAQLAALLLAVIVIMPLSRPAPYHALSGAPAAAAGNMLVMFRPEVRTGAVTALLAKSGARIVDGPTAAGAFVIAVPAERRAALLTELRAEPALSMAEPIDP